MLVVGGGAAGMSAALAAAGAGARVLLVHRGDRLGGGLADDVPASSAIASGLAARVAAEAAIDVLTGSDAIAWYEEGTIAVDRHPDLLLVEANAVVLATGGYDAGLPFPDWDLPGVMTVSAARRLVNRYGVLPGSRVVFVTGDDHAYAVAARLVALGAEVACVADLRGGDGDGEGNGEGSGEGGEAVGEGGEAAARRQPGPASPELGVAPPVILSPTRRSWPSWRPTASIC